MRKFTAIREKIIVKVVDKSEVKSSGGIIIAELDIDQQFKMEAEIVDIGKAAFTDVDGEDLKVGDRIIIARGSGILLEEFGDGCCLKVIRDIDVCCKVEETVVN